MLKQKTTAPGEEWLLAQPAVFLIHLRGRLLTVEALKGYEHKHPSWESLGRGTQGTDGMRRNSGGRGTPRAPGAARWDWICRGPEFSAGLSAKLLIYFRGRGTARKREREGALICRFTLRNAHNGPQGQGRNLEPGTQSRSLCGDRNPITGAITAACPGLRWQAAGMWGS